jgi:uncharacterized protein (DUF58 family)
MLPSERVGVAVLSTLAVVLIVIVAAVFGVLAYVVASITSLLVLLAAVANLGTAMTNRQTADKALERERIQLDRERSRE